MRPDAARPFSLGLPPEIWLHDLRLAVRTLRRHPVFALGAGAASRIDPQETLRAE